MMDVLKPKLIEVEGRCYRFYESSVWSNIRNITPYVEDNDELEEKEDETYADIDIVPHGTSRFKHSFHVPKALFPFIIGSKHATRKRLETETKTTIQIPNVGQDGDIVIIGFYKKGIIAARSRIDLIVESSKSKIKPTHFVSIPVNEGQIIMKFNAFKKDVLNNSERPIRGVDETIFQTPSKLHLTICALVLLDDAERNQAIKALEHCKEHIIMPAIKKYGQIKIHLQGTDIMYDDPADVRVLYASVINSEGLQEIADQIRDYYHNIGLSRDQNRVKLHVTLLNVRYRQDEEDSNSKRKETFDATNILKNHHNTFFGETTLKQMHISQMGTISSDGYYQATSKINLLGS